jgi:hypothetical protein
LIYIILKGSFSKGSEPFLFSSEVMFAFQKNEIPS